MKHTYAVVEGERLVGVAGRIALARRHREGIAGRRIIRLDAAGQVLWLRDMRGGKFRIVGKEVT